MKLYNSLTRSIEPFTPTNDTTVTLYTCGPTVYDYAHIGNLRTFIFEDILKRTLTFSGYRVKHVMNITDVGHLTDDADAGEDKMEKGARREKKTVWDVAQMYTDAFLSDIDALNIQRAEDMPKATEYITEQIAMIQELEAKGHTYRTSDGIYFDTSTFPAYGEMARLDIRGLQEGARVEKNDEKRHATDFALWKFSPAGEQRAMEWESPWGVGFPGWHIECSAMARALLGDQIDIHCGGVDHMPVHHTNEIAQSECATGKSPFARIWMHGEFLLINEGRMGKSVGNFIRLQDLIDKGFDPMVYRYFVLTAHYRSKLNFTWEELKKQQITYHSIIWKLSQMPDDGHIDTNTLTTFTEIIEDDLALPRAIALVWETLKSDLPETTKASTLYAMDAVLGLKLKERSHALREQLKNAGSNFAELLERRSTARTEKDFATADVIRNEIQAKGFDIEDTSNGTILKPRA